MSSMIDIERECQIKYTKLYIKYLKYAKKLSTCYNIERFEYKGVNLGDVTNFDQIRILHNNIKDNISETLLELRGKMEPNPTNLELFEIEIFKD